MPDISIIIPTYNEEKILQNNLFKIYNLLSQKYPRRCAFILVDSNSTDTTPTICKEFVKTHKDSSYVNLAGEGKGGKIKYIAQQCTTPYAGWIDSDLPLKIEEYCRMMRTVISGNAYMAISSRYTRGAKIERHFTRLIFSKAYHALVRVLFFINVGDTTSGAKFWNREITQKIWPLVRGEKWFFDTELVYYCIKKGYPIVEVPVTFNDRKDSRFDLISESYKMGIELFQFRIRTLFSL